MKKEFSNYWFATGNPSFLIKIIKQQASLTLEDFDFIQLRESNFDSFEIENLNLHALLFQTGYLTIKGYNPARMTYILSYTNYEITRSFKENLFDAYFKDAGNSANYLNLLCDAADNSNLEEMLYQLQRIFLNLNYDVKLSYENHFQNTVYLIFNLLGYMIETEYKTILGRIDAVIKTPRAIYIFEFKINQDARTALKQIYEKEYYTRFLNQNRIIYLIGINFNTKKQTIDDYLYEKLMD